MADVERPAFVKNEHLLYLDTLRESGITNMYGARPYLQQAFRGLGAEKAGKVLVYWMRTFTHRHPPVQAKGTGE